MDRDAAVQVALTARRQRSAYVGYDLMFLTNVIRPADQIDPTISSGQLPTSAFFGTPGPNRPLVEFKKNDAYLHGLTVGLTLTY